MPVQTEPSPQVPGLFIAMDPPDHTRLRRKLIGAFTVRRMKQLEEHIVEVVERQLDEMAGMAPPVDLVKAFALPENPGQLAELRANPDLMPDAVEELMRYLSVADIFYRYATEDIELGGETIPEGSTVVVSLLAANRDPRRFDDPDTLDIRRKARGHVSFGHGVHQCLGRQLARIEMRAGFAGLLRRFPTLRLTVPAGEVPLRTDTNIYGVHELPVTWTEATR